MLRMHSSMEQAVYLIPLNLLCPQREKKPERFVRTLNDVSRDKIDSILFSWGDIKELRKPGAKLYVIMNNTEKPVRKELFNALTIYGGTPLLWSEKENILKN